jgi:hypothetical protein
MSQNAAFDDASIPVLTEFVEEAPPAAHPAPANASVPDEAEPDLAAAPGPAVLPEPPIPAGQAEPVAVAVAASADGDLQTRAIDSWSAQEWDQLERRLCERILHQLQGRVDFVLEQRLRDSMAEVLQLSLSGLTEQIREGLQQTIEKIVVRAVSQELAHLQTLKK